MDGLVGQRNVARAGVGVGIDRDRLHAQPMRRLDDPTGDLTAVGDQDFVEHQMAHFGLRLARKALMPSTASGVTLCSATTAASRPATLLLCGKVSISATNCLASFWTEGAASFSSR